MQLFYTLDAIEKKYPDGLKTYLEKRVADNDKEYFQRPNNLRELLVESHLLPFFMQYLKNLTSELEIMIHPTVARYLTDLEIPLDDLSGLSDDDYVRFKELFMQNRISPHLCNRGKNMDNLFDFAVDVLARRVPTENVSVKVGEITSRILLVPMPEGLHHEDYEEVIMHEDDDGTEREEKLSYKKNTNECGLIVLKVPQYEQQEEIPIEVTKGDETAEAAATPKKEEKPAADDKKEEEKAAEEAPATKTVKKMIDEDQKEKALAVRIRDVEQLAEDRCNYFAVNEYAGKLVREDFLDFIKKTYPEFFEDNEDYA